MKYTVPVVLAIILGLLMAKVVLNQYDNKADVKTVFESGEKLYFIETGTFNTLEEMEKNNKNLLYYIYSVEDNIYHSYVGISLNKENITKLEGFFKNKGYSTNIREIRVANKEFVELLKQYDLLITNTTDDNILNAICNQIINKYKELVLNES